MRTYSFIIIITLTILVLSTSVAIGSPNLVWVVIDQTSLHDLSMVKTSNIDLLQQKGAFGLINVRTADHLKPRSTYLSIGSGNRSQGNIFSHYGENIGKEVINRKINYLQKINTDSTYRSELGLIGTVCRENNLKVAVLGNSDSSAGKKRTIVSMAMDDKGFIPLGDVSKSILTTIKRPWGYQTDWSELEHKFKKYSHMADSVFIETGDISRIVDCLEIQSNEKLEYKREALKKIDEFVGFLLDNINLDNTQLGIIVPTPSPIAVEKGYKLSWILLAGRNIKHGWLTSVSTRKKGLVTISDLAPSFFQSNGLNVGDLNLRGNPVKVKSQKVDWQDLIKLNDKISIISNLRSPAIKSFIILQILVIILALISIVLNKKNKKNLFVIIRQISEYLLLALFLVPINYLLISILYFPNVWYYLLALIALTIIEIYLLSLITKCRLKKVIVITLTLVILIICDLSNHFILMSDSLLGYSSIIGARYYGLGNEYMGLFVGGMLIGITGLMELTDKKWNKYNPLFLLLSVLICTYYVGASNLGANFGGTITTIFAGSIAYIRLGKRVTFKKIFCILVLLISFLVLLIFLDYSHILGPTSHIGRVVKPLLNGNFSSIKLIIYRKLAMNIKLLRWTIWTKVLLAFIVYLLIIFKQPVGRLQKLFNKFPYLAAGFYGGITGSVVTMFVNDSGVVAAATLLFFPILTLLYLIQELEY